MLEQTINIWEPYKAGSIICITTNGTVKSNGECVMGRGCAAEAKDRFPELPFALGTHIQSRGNEVCYFPEFRLISFPVKHNWYEKANIRLIERSARQLVSFGEINELEGPIYLPRPGCGNGHLNWEDVKPYLEFLPDKFIVTDKPKVKKTL